MDRDKSQLKVSVEWRRMRWWNESRRGWVEGKRRVVTLQSVQS